MIILYLFMLFSMAFGVYYYEQPRQQISIQPSVDGESQVIAQNMAFLASIIENTVALNKGIGGIPTQTTINPGSLQNQPQWIQNYAMTPANISVRIHMGIQQTKDASGNNAINYIVYVDPKELNYTVQGNTAVLCSKLGEVTTYAPNVGIRKGAYIVMWNSGLNAQSQSNTATTTNISKTPIPSYVFPDGDIGIARTITYINNNK